MTEALVLYKGPEIETVRLPDSRRVIVTYGAGDGPLGGPVGVAAEALDLGVEMNMLVGRLEFVREFRDMAMARPGFLTLTPRIINGELVELRMVPPERR